MLVSALYWIISIKFVKYEDNDDLIDQKVSLNVADECGPPQDNDDDPNN